VTLALPEGTATLGNTKVKFGLACADLDAPKLATEINAVTSVDGSCFLFPEGWNPTANVNKGTRRRRLCSRNTSEVFNTTQYVLAALQYVHDPQEDDTDPVNDLRALLTQGTKVFAWERQGLDAQSDDFAVGDHSITHHIEVGPQVRMGDPTDENGEYYIMQEVIYVDGGGPVPGVVVT
jgi:hypothetical protein